MTGATSTMPATDEPQTMSPVLEPKVPCRLPDGSLISATPSQCDALGGTVVPFDVTDE